MNKLLLNTGVQLYIQKYLNTDILSVLLKKSPFEGVTAKELAQQMAARKKCEKKLPSWFNTKDIYYPKKINIEQSSSEVTAKYKAALISGKSLLDLSGGFGVDAYFFSKKFQQVYHCEIEEELAEIAAHNFEKLGAKNIIPIKDDCIAFLSKTDLKFDWIYVDPSRRDSSDKKVHKLSDCEPDIPAQLQLIFRKTNNMLIKASPLLDTSSAISSLGPVSAIQIVAVANEVKEVLYVVNKGYKGEIIINTRNYIKAGHQSFDFTLKDEKATIAVFSEPLKYLYEPNAAIMKAGAFKIIGRSYALKKLHEHTHLYTSEALHDFPGRRFEILKNVRYNKREIQQLSLSKANVATRNFPETVAKIRQRHGIKDGGDSYLFFITDQASRLRVLLCSKC